MTLKMRTAAIALLAGATMLVAPSSASAGPAEDVHYCLAAYPSSGHAYIWYRYNSCKTLYPGQSYTHDWIVGSWDGLVPC